MKKTIVMLLVCSLMLLTVGSVFACDNCAEGPISKTNGLSVSTPLYAKVNQYAKVCWVYADTLNFTGAAHETKYGKAVYNVESNCPVIGITRGGSFAQGSSKLTSNYQDYHNSWKNADQTFTSSKVNMGKHLINVPFKAKTGEISDQPAGFYSTTLTTTIYSQY